MRTFLFLLLAAAMQAQATAPEVFGEHAWDDRKATAHLQWRDPGFPQSGVVRHALPAIEQQRIDQVRMLNSEAATKRLKIGIERNARDESLVPPSAPLDWRVAPDGGRTARIEVTSDGAVALRVGLDIAQMPEGAELRFIGNADDAVVSMVDASEVAALRQAQPVFWSPVTEGDTQQIEVYLPPKADPRWLRYSLESVSHLFVSPAGSLAGAKIGESDFCEIDVRCVTNPSTAYVNARSSVARMVYQNGGSFLCTGTLLNDTDAGTQVPYFFSAAHCFTSQSVASTLTTFWFYEATGCDSGVLDTANSRQIGGGATLLFANASSDVLFLRLNNAAPAGAWFLGWNAAAIANGTSVLAIHHPAGDVKKVSLGQVKGLGPSSLASGNFIQVGYTDGTTEGGSSGCGLLTLANGEYQMRGGLLGGSAGCSNSGNVATASNSDDFSRFDLAFSSLQSFLAPASTPPPPSSIDYSGAWSNGGQSGWGLNVIRGSSGIYAMYIYHYDDASTPAWYLSAGNLSGTSYSAPLLTFTGPWFGITPFNPAAVSNRTSGTLSVNFNSATSATINFTNDGRTVSTTLSKLAF